MQVEHCVFAAYSEAQERILRIIFLETRAFPIAYSTKNYFILHDNTKHIAPHILAPHRTFAPPSGGKHSFNGL